MSKPEGTYWLPATSTCYRYLVVTNASTSNLRRRLAGELNPTRGDLFDPDCPTRVILDRIGDKWTVLVVLLLSNGPRRFTELRDGIGRVAPKVLTQTLRRLERDGLLTREVFAEVPPRVEYTLTPLGRSLISPISAVTEWAETHVPAISQAQRHYDLTTG
jgi:DNA-binding HxlR family transcriptional regulator